jgi:NADPH:quinone reductase-like Zn-dependent oxidoreductase
MRAVQYSTLGGGAAALQHVEIPVPVPAKDQVLVKVEAASVNPVDWKVIQAGVFKLFLPPKLPYIPGTDIAGEVVALGPGVTSFAVGDKVSSWTDIKNGGSLAEYAIAPIRTTAKRPESVSAIDGASLGVAGVTALQSVRDSAGIKLDGSSAGKNLLITAASGGVGTYAVQLAKLGGAHVTATCGARNIALLKSLGADEVLDYKTPEGENLLSPSGKKYDVVIHCSKFQPFSFFKPQLARSAKVIDLTPSGKGLLATGFQLATFASQKFVPFLMSTNSNSDLALLTNLVNEGKLKTVVDSTFPLSVAEKAWEKQIEGHSTGKILVTMVGE